MNLVRQFLERIQTSKSLEEAKAFAEAAVMVHDADSMLQVRIESIPSGSKIQTIKLVRELLGWGLKESKEFTEQLPAIFPNKFRKDTAEQMKRALENIDGVKVTLK